MDIEQILLLFLQGYFSNVLINTVPLSVTHHHQQYPERHFINLGKFLWAPDKLHNILLLHCTHNYYWVENGAIIVIGLKHAITCRIVLEREIEREKGGWSWQEYRVRWNGTLKLIHRKVPQPVMSSSKADDWWWAQGNKRILCMCAYVPFFLRANWCYACMLLRMMVFGLIRCCIWNGSDRYHYFLAKKQGHNSFTDLPCIYVCVSFLHCKKMFRVLSIIILITPTNHHIFI